MTQKGLVDDAGVALFGAVEGPVKGVEEPGQEVDRIPYENATVLTN